MPDREIKVNSEITDRLNNNLQKLSSVFEHIQKDLVNLDLVGDAAAGTQCSGVGCTGCGIEDLEGIVLPGEANPISGAELIKRLKK